jgi:hypothetical protein
MNLTGVFTRTAQFYVTTGLVLSVVTDLLVTSTLCFFLSRYRTGFTYVLLYFSDLGLRWLICRTDTIVDKIIQWTIQTGAMTTLVGILSMVTAIAMPTNLVWLGIHMLISKRESPLLSASLLLTVLISTVYTTMTIAQ